MKVLSYLILFTLFISCAAKELMVRNADTLLEYQINKRLPLNSTQEEKLSKDIDAFLNQEKKVAEALVPVVDSIDVMEPTKVEGQFQEISLHYRKVSFDLMTLIAGYMVQLDKKQVSQFFENLDDENKDAKKKTQSDRREDAEERLEKFIGDLNGEQKKIIKSYDSYYEQMMKTRLEQRVVLHAQYKEILGGALPIEEKKSSLVKAYVNYQDENFKNAKTLEIIQKMIPTLTSDQKKLFNERKKEVKEMLLYFMQVKF